MAEQQDLFSFAPPVMVPQGDGSVLIKPGKLLKELTPAQAARELGVHRTTIYGYIDAGMFKTLRRPSPNRILLDAREVQELKKATYDAEFWTKDLKRAVRKSKRSR